MQALVGIGVHEKSIKMKGLLEVRNYLYSKPLEKITIKQSKIHLIALNRVFVQHYFVLA